MTDCVRYDRLILLMDDEELEKFCRAWTEKKTGYVEVKRIGTTGDMGRDVVGCFTDKRHEGAWDNYQCKQYRKGVSRSQGLLVKSARYYIGPRRAISRRRGISFSRHRKD